MNCKLIAAAFRNATDVSQIQMGFVFGVLYMAFFSLLLSKFLSAGWHYILFGLGSILFFYLEAVIKWYWKL